MMNIGNFLFWLTVSQILTLYKYIVIKKTLKTRQINLVVLHAKLYFHSSESSIVALEQQSLHQQFFLRLLIFLIFHSYCKLVNACTQCVSGNKTN